MPSTEQPRDASAAQIRGSAHTGGPTAVPASAGHSPDVPVCPNPRCKGGWVERGDNESGGAPAFPCRTEGCPHRLERGSIEEQLEHDYRMRTTPDE